MTDRGDPANRDDEPATVREPASDLLPDDEEKIEKILSVAPEKP